MKSIRLPKDMEEANLKIAKLEKSLKAMTEKAVQESARAESEKERAESEKERADKETSNIKAKDAVIAALVERLAWYEEQLARFNLKLFGSSSEKNVVPPLTLEESEQCFNETEASFDIDAVEPDPETVAKEIEAETKKRRKGKKSKGKRNRDLENVTHKTIILEPDEADKICKYCRRLMEKIGEGQPINPQLVYIPGHYELISYVQPKYACKCPDCDHGGKPEIIVVKQPPLSFIPNSGLASASLVAKIISDKYASALPLYRQQTIMNGMGINISRQTMANWVIRVALDYLFLLYAELRNVLSSKEVIMADETVVQVLHEGDRSPTSQSRMWVTRTASGDTTPIVLFTYDKSRGKAVLVDILKGFTSKYIQSDGYSSYQNLPNMINVGCWQHAKRPFVEALKVMSAEQRTKSQAYTGYQFINDLFLLEMEFKDLKPEERYRRRLKKSKPIAEKFFAWAETCKATPKSLLGAGITYAINQKQYLMNVFLDGRLELSNNLSENAVRPFVVGRKNWLFCNTPKGADASAIIYSIVETAKANGLVPFDYLHYVLDKISQGSFHTSMISELLPWSSSIPDMCKNKFPKQN